MLIVLVGKYMNSAIGVATKLINDLGSAIDFSLLSN
jgi:hypothetical protein